MSPAKTSNPQFPGKTETGGSVLPAEAERQLKDDASAAVETAKEEFGAIKAEAEAQAGAIAEEAKAELGKMADKAKGMAAEQKEFVSGQLEGVAEAVNKVAGELEAQNATTAGYARTLADTVTSFSDTIKNKDVDELLAMAQDFGRRQPAVFMAAAALAGFAASRFLMSSAKRRQVPATTADIYGGTSLGDGGTSATSPGSARQSGGSFSATRHPMGGNV
jgi:hypothetical protein